VDMGGQGVIGVVIGEFVQVGGLGELGGMGFYMGG
jgi:hypothetical protein